MGITTAVVVGAGVAAAGAIGGGLIASKGAKSAAQTQAEAAREAGDVTLEQYYQNREDLAPWREAGAEAVNKLAELTKVGPGEYEKSPYYNFLMEEGTTALERGAAARGKQFSGEEAKALTQYGKNLASTDYDTWLNNWYKSLTPWQSLAGVGETAAAQTAQAGGQAATNISQTIMAGGQAKAAGQLGAANALSQPIQWGSNQLLNYALLNQMGMFNKTPTPYQYGGLYTNF